MSRKKKQKELKRSIRLNGIDIILDITKVTAVSTKVKMIHLDELPDGSWRLIYNSDHIPDFTKVTSLEIIRN